jgi:hypothetical protein
MQIQAAVAFGAVCALSMIGFSSEAVACENDTDCKGDRVCYEKKCIAPEAAKELEMQGVKAALPPTEPSAALPLPPTTPAPSSNYVPMNPVVPASPAVSSEVDDRGAVEQALRIDVGKYYSGWQYAGRTRIPKFSDYMSYRLNRDKRRGIVLAVVGTGIFVIGAGISIPLFAVSSNRSSACWDEDNYELDSEEQTQCLDEAGAPAIAGGVVAGVFGAASLTLVIIGAVKAKMAKRRLQRLSQLRTAMLESPRIAFVGIAPLVDSQNTIGGLSLHWQF